MEVDEQQLRLARQRHSCERQGECLWKVRTKDASLLSAVGHNDDGRVLVYSRDQGSSRLDA